MPVMLSMTFACQRMHRAVRVTPERMGLIITAKPRLNVRISRLIVTLRTPIPAVLASAEVGTMVGDFGELVNWVEFEGIFWS